MNNGQTEEALIIRSKLLAHGYRLYGLPEMKKNEQILFVRYLQNNEFNVSEINGIAKLFECRLYKIED